MAQLVCKSCGARMDIPEHHGVPMRAMKVGIILKKIKRIECQSCGYGIEVPKHCGVPMSYKES